MQTAGTHAWEFAFLDRLKYPAYSIDFYLLVSSISVSTNLAPRIIELQTNALFRVQVPAL